MKGWNNKMTKKIYTENEKKVLDMYYEVAKQLLGYKKEDKPEAGKLVGEIRVLREESAKN